MFKLVDRYIIKKFFGTLIFILLLLSAIIVVFDISQKIDGFIEFQAPLSAIVFDYYFNFLPWILNNLLPLFIFVAVIFFTSRMAQQSELIAIMNSGASLNRILRPYMVCALVLTTVSIYLYNEVIPNNQKRRYKFEYQYVTPNRTNISRNLHRQVLPGVFVYMESFIFSDSMAYNFRLDEIKNKNLVTRISATRISWNKAKKKWRLDNYIIRKLGSRGDVITTGAALDTVLTFNPKDFIVDEHLVEQMNYAQLNTFIEREKMRGSDNVEWHLIEKYQRFAIPFSSFILTLIGFAVSHRKSREGMGGQLLIGIVLSFSYIMLMRFASEIAKSSLLPSWLAIWIPNILYLILGIYLYTKNRRG
jgi:lipopolysaccharide export system permease protein